MLVYKLPRSKTTARKVALWRKLKKLGVYAVQDSICVLPLSEKNLETFEWIASELRETGGEASVWEASTLTVSQEREMRDHFLDQVNVQYRRIVQEAASILDEEGLRQLWARFNRVRAQDYLKSPLAMEARAACERRAIEFREEERN
ncbi:MAG: Chromate resistance protein ChrB [Acidobacteriota bacterium]